MVIPSKKKDVIQLLKRIDKKLSEEVIIYLLGGGAMALRGIKDSTIDLDFVVIKKRNYVALKKAIEKIGYKLDETSYDSRIYKNAVILFNKGSSRIDIFVKSIVGMLDFTKEMEKRAEILEEFDKLRIKLASNEDIFLLKSLSDRDKDIIDCRTLLLTGLKSDIIVKERITQHREDIKWIFWLYEMICRLQNRYSHLRIRFKTKVWQECRKNWKYKPKNFMKDIGKLETHIKEKKFRDNVEEDLKGRKYHYRHELLRELC